MTLQKKGSVYANKFTGIFLRNFLLQKFVISGKNVSLKISENQSENSWNFLQISEISLKFIVHFALFRESQTFLWIKKFCTYRKISYILSIYLNMYKNLWKFVWKTELFLKNAEFLWKCIIF